MTIWHSLLGYARYQRSFSSFQSESSGWTLLVSSRWASTGRKMCCPTTPTGAWRRPWRCLTCYKPTSGPQWWSAAARFMSALCMSFLHRVVLAFRRVNRSWRCCCTTRTESWCISLWSQRDWLSWTEAEGRGKPHFTQVYTRTRDPPVCFYTLTPNLN